MRLIFTFILLSFSLLSFSQVEKSVQFVSAQISDNTTVQVILSPLDEDHIDKSLDLHTKEISQADKDRVLRFYGVDFNSKIYGENGDAKASPEEIERITSEHLQKFTRADIPQLPTPKFNLNDFLNLDEQDKEVLRKLKLTTKYKKRIASIKKSGKGRLATLRFLVSGGFTFIGTFVGADVVEFQGLMSILDDPSSIGDTIKFVSDPAVLKAALIKATGFGLFAGTAGAITTYFWNQISEHYIQGNFVENQLKKIKNLVSFKKKPTDNLTQEVVEEIASEIESRQTIETASQETQSELKKFLKKSFEKKPGDELGIVKTSKFALLEGSIGGLYLIVARSLGISGGPIETALRKEIRNTAVTIFTQGDLNITVSNITAQKEAEIEALKVKIRNSDLHIRHQFAMIEQLDDLLVYFKNQETIKALNGSALFAVGNTVVRFGLDAFYYITHAVMKAYAIAQNPRERLDKMKSSFIKSKNFLEDFSWALSEDTYRFNQWLKSTALVSPVISTIDAISDATGKLYRDNGTVVSPRAQSCSQLLSSFLAP